MNNIEIWIKNNTFRHKDFCDLIKLIDLKMEQKIKISLCFPTLNEEKTIGKSVSIMKKQLMDTVPLLDEIVVIDSDSLDNTRIIAKEAGAKVYKASECMIEEGYKKGKGENLWKALSILKGDIIVYIDSDISNITERFAYGIIGPLLLKPNVKFVKAFYQRPYSIDNHPISLTEGGRVTEILIRPLFSYFFPELAGIIQPLSGECAGYRSVFEELYYPIGYGIEVGMLIDIYQKFGLDAIAQVDLDLRIHKNQSISSLSRMSFGILQTFFKRIKEYRNIDVDVDKYFFYKTLSHKGKYELSSHKILEEEREPIKQLKSYRNMDK